MKARKKEEEGDHERRSREEKGKERTRRRRKKNKKKTRAAPFRDEGFFLFCPLT